MLHLSSLNWLSSDEKNPCDSPLTSWLVNTVDGSEILNNHLGCIKPLVNSVINYQPQLVQAGFQPLNPVGILMLAYEIIPI